MKLLLACIRKQIYLYIIKLKQIETMKTIIKDTLTNEYYCVPMSETDPITGEAIAGYNDFPFWSENKEDAYVFGSIILAQNEININDLTQDGQRVPVIVINE